MEALGLILIAAALFCHSWYILGLYPDGRTAGIYVGAFGLAALISTTMAPMLLIGGDAAAIADAGGDSAKSFYSIAAGLAETTMMKTLIIVWAIYAVGIGAQSLLDFDERAIGFSGAVAALVSLFAMFFFADTLLNPYGEEVVLVLTTSTLLLTVVAVTMFAYLAVPFNNLRPVAGWFNLVGSIAVFIIGVIIAMEIVVSDLA